MKEIRVRDFTFRVFDRGTGTPILFVHGFPLDHTMWHRQLEHFSKSHRVIAPDLRGFGDSTGEVNQPLTMDLHAADLDALLSELEVEEPIVFCGLSMGGYIFWPFQQKYASRLRAAILCDTRAAADASERAAERLKTADSVEENGPEALARAMLPKLISTHTAENHSSIADALKNTILNTNRKTIAQALRGMAARTDDTNRLSEIDVPTLLLVGEHDELTPSAEMKSIAETMPRGKFAEIPNVGHMAPMEDPAACNRAIEEFLADII